MSIPVDTYFIVTPGSNVENRPGVYATLGPTDLFFYITETKSLRVVNMNSSGGTAAPGLISYTLAQNVKWVGAITMPGNGVVHVYYADNAGSIFYAPYISLGSTVTFQQLGAIVAAVTFSTIYAPNSSPQAFLIMVDDGLRHNLYVAGDSAYQSILSHTVTYNNSLAPHVYLTRPSIAMHPSDTDVITVTFEQTVIMTSETSVGFYEIKVPGIT